MWIWYLLIGSGSGTSPVESQLLPGNNFTSECNIPGVFMCGDGKCIPGGWKCDSYPDCFDSSDERGCPKVRQKCAATFFACAKGMHCIIGRFRCNGFNDCPDGSDEENCTGNPLLCSASRFHCRNGRCVDRSFLCNGENNCHDNTDEENCITTQQAPGEDVVTLDYRLRYYPSITYAVIGSAVIFVLVVALLALVLHHQRKRSVLLPRTARVGARGGPHHQPLLLSRLLIVERSHGHHTLTAAGSLSPPTPPPGLQLLTGAFYPPPSPLTHAPPSYSQAVLDASRPPWFDLPPPPYPPEGEVPSDRELPRYEPPQAQPQAPRQPQHQAQAQTVPLSQPQTQQPPQSQSSIQSQPQAYVHTAPNALGQPLHRTSSSGESDQLEG